MDSQTGGREVVVSLDGLGWSRVGLDYLLSQCRHGLSKANILNLTRLHLSKNLLQHSHHASCVRIHTES